MQGAALAFDGFNPPYKATLTKNLREPAAIIIAKNQKKKAVDLVR